MINGWFKEGNSNSSNKNKKSIREQVSKDIYNLEGELISGFKSARNTGSLHKRGQFHEMHPTFEAIGRMKPSLFNLGGQQDDYNYQSTSAISNNQILQKKKRKPRKNSDIRPKKQQRQQINIINFNSKRRLSSLKFNLQDDDDNDETIKIPGQKQNPIIYEKIEHKDQATKRKQRKQIKLLFSMDDSEIFFADELASEDKEVNKKFEEKREEEDEKQLKNHHEQKFQEAKQHNEKQFKDDNHILSVYEPKQLNSILNPSQSMLEAQRRITEDYLEGNYENPETFIRNSIPSGSRLCFEAFVENSDIFLKQFSFWLKGDSGNMAIMRAKKQIALTHNQYTISSYNQANKSWSFAAKVQNIVDNNRFQISDQSYPTKKEVLLLGQIDVFSKVSDLPVLSMYYPEFSSVNNQQVKKLFIKSQSYLKSCLRSKESNASYLGFCALTEQLEKKVMREHSLVKTKKTIALRDKSGQIKLFIGKICSKRYKILAGSGVSPLLIFAFFIVMVQS